MKHTPLSQLIVFAMTCSFAATARCATWDGGGGNAEFSTAKNWDDDAVPAKESIAVIDNGDKVERSVDSVVDRTVVGGGSTLNITGGTHDDERSGARVLTTVGAGSAGTVQQSGGGYRIGHGVRLGARAGGAGTYRLTGGEFSIMRSSRSALQQKKQNSLEIGVAEGTGLLEISGGTLLTRVGVGVGAGGTFSVVGSAARQIGIGSHSKNDGDWFQQAGGTLKVAIDTTPTGVTPILIDDVDDDGQGDVIFEKGALLDVGFLGEENLGTFTVMNWDGTVTDHGLRFAPGVDTALWSFSVHTDRLTVTAQTLVEPE